MILYHKHLKHKQHKHMITIGEVLFQYFVKLNRIHVQAMGGQ